MWIVIKRIIFMNYLSSSFSSSPVEPPSPLSGLRDLKIPPDFIKKCLFLLRKQCREHFPVKLKWEVVTGEALSNSNNNINKLARPPVGQSTYKLLLRMRVNSNKQSRWVAGPNWEIIIKYSLITERGPDIRFTLDISCNTFKWKNKKWQICLVSRPLVPA